MNSRTQALHSTAYSSIAIYSEMLLGMVTSVLIARQLGPGHYGIYSSLVWFVGMGVAAANSGVTTGVIKFIAELRGRDEESRIPSLLAYMRKTQWEHLAIVLFGGVILLLAMGHRLTFRIGLAEAAMLAGSIILRAPYMFNIAVAKGFEAFDATAKVALIAAPLNLAMVALAVFMRASIEWFLVVYLISGVLFHSISKYQARNLLQELPHSTGLSEELTRRVRRHLRIVSPTVIIGFFITSGVEILFLNQFATATEAGYFKVAYLLASGVVLLVPGVFGAVLLPMMAKAVSQGRQIGGRRFVAATRYLTLLAAPVVTFCLCFSRPAIEFLFGSAYASAAPAFALIALSSAISTVTQGASSFLVGADRQHLILILMIIFGVLKVALDFTLISMFGLNGAVAAVMVLAVLSAIAYIGIALRVAGITLEWRRLSNIIFSAVATSLLVIPVHLLGLEQFWTLLLGGILILLAYIPLTLLLRCWNDDDIEQLQGLHTKFLMGRPKALAWLLTHAREQEAAKGAG